MSPGSRTLLATAHARVVQLVGSLARLRGDLSFQAAGGALLIAVDFSEIHAFLHPDRPDRDTVHLGLGPATGADAAVLTRLGLSHLLRTYGSGLYLLPPHTRELDGYLRSFEAKAVRAEGLAAAARAWIEQLDARERASLERLEQPGELSEAERVALVELMQDEASRLCDQVSELTGWLTADTAIGELRGLVREGRLSYRIDQALAAAQASPGALGPPAADDERRAFRAFPERTRSRRRAQKMIDARALLALRDLNRALAPRDARLVLVTRDAGMAEAARTLSADRAFGWPEVADHLRTLDEVLLDLLLQGAPALDQRLAWLTETERLFRGVQGPLHALLSREPSDAGGSERFQALARRRLRELQALWRRHRQLRLSLAVPHVDWLSTDFLAPEVAPAQAPPGDDGAVPKLRRLVTFVATESFQERVRDDLRQLRLDLVAQSLQMLFLGRIGAQKVDRLVSFFAAGWTGEDRDDGTLLRSTRYTPVCSLEFVSDRYRALVASLSGWDQDEKVRYERLERAFFDLVQQAAGHEHAAEGFLFMALTLAMLGQWDEARAAAEASLSMPGRMLAHEARYLLAVVTRRLPVDHPDQRLAHLVDAYNHALAAVEGKRRFGGRQDPRYLFEQGTLALAWRQLAEQQGGVQAARARSKGAHYHPGWIRRAAAIRMLEEALALVTDDPRLEVDLHNNLAYAAVTATPPDLDRAAHHVTELQARFAQAARQERPVIPPTPWPAIRDTLLLVQAHAARGRGDAAAVRACVQDWDALLADPNLLPADRASIAHTVSEVRRWPILGAAPAE